jgi:hypothetical protein
MRTSSRSPNLVLQLVVVAALIVTVRLPFLLRADRFFDADEAVEGLMARHVVRGEFPAFIWGQSYKGVPEVYLATAIFGVIGPTVTALKSATLACFAVFACLQFALARRLFSQRIAWISTAFVAAGPPSLVLWSLSANAEIVMTLVAGAWMGLALLAWQRSGSLRALASAGTALGFGLWVQQYIVFYVIALAITIALMLPDRVVRIRLLIAASEAPGWIRVMARAAAVIGAVYVVAGAVAFATGGFDLTIGDVAIGMKSPQKLWRIGAAALIVAGFAHGIGSLVTPPGRLFRRPVAAAAIGFVIGYAPALAASFQGGRSAPVPRMDVHDLRRVAGAIAYDVLPVLLGFRSPTTEWLGVSLWFGLVFAAVAAVSYVALYKRRRNPFFHTLLIVVPVLFIVSGSFVDAQSYRYLMPIYGALPIVLAIGVDAAWRKSIALAAVMLAAVAAVWTLEQVRWYQRLAPDTKSPAAIACLESAGVRGVFADYWVSYKLTFLTDERVIVAPGTAFDRYPPYTAFVRSFEPGSSQPCHSLLIQ